MIAQISAPLVAHQIMVFNMPFRAKLDNDTKRWCVTCPTGTQVGEAPSLLAAAQTALASLSVSQILRGSLADCLTVAARPQKMNIALEMEIGSCHLIAHREGRLWHLQQSEPRVRPIGCYRRDQLESEAIIASLGSVRSISSHGTKLTAFGRDHIKGIRMLWGGEHSDRVSCPLGEYRKSRGEISFTPTGEYLGRASFTEQSAEQDAVLHLLNSTILVKNAALGS